MEIVSETRVPLGNYWEFSSADGFKHLDHRWLRTAWWHRHKHKWYPRDPTKPIVWARLDSWKPEPDEEFAERTKGWFQGGARLDHEEVEVGGIYRLYENQATKVRVKSLNRYETKPIVFVQHLDGSKEDRYLFTDEL